MIVSSRKLIKSKNLIEVGVVKRFITNEERDFLIVLFNKYFNGLHKNNPISEQNLYGIIIDLARFHPNIIFDKDFYIFKDKPCNDYYFTYGFKINKIPWSSAFDVIRYILSYIIVYYGLPKNKWGEPYKIQITEDDIINVIGV